MKQNRLVRKLFLTMTGVFALTAVQAQVGQIIWEDNFNSLNTTTWTESEGDGCSSATGCGWGNWELESYSKNNITIEDIAGEPGNKALVLQAKKESVGNSQFTSGKVNSENKLSIKYGLIEIRIKTPAIGVGLWPAAWLLGTNLPAAGWPQCGEIDMMEMGHKASARAEQDFPSASIENYVGANAIWYEAAAIAPGNLTGAASIAYDKGYNQPYVATTPLSQRFVIYRLYWDNSSLRYTVEDNGSEVNLYTGPFTLGPATTAFQKPFYFLLNLAVGGNFTDAATAAQVTAPLPSKMYIDYIRVRKWNGQGEVYTADKIVANAGGDKTVLTGAVALNATGSYGAITNYVWSEKGVQIATGKTASVTLAQGSHTVTLTVSDASGKTATDIVTIQVGAATVGEIIWEENFNSFDANTWGKILGDGCSLPAGCGWGNWELESYNENNVTIEDIVGEAGNKGLVLQAKKEVSGNSQFTSGKVSTENKLSIKYGLIEVRMKTPVIGVGIWPAIWLLGTDLPTAGWPQCGEIDMMEMGHKASFRTAQDYPGTSAENYVGANAIWYETGAMSTANPTGAASIATDHWYNQPYVSTAPLSQRFVIYRLYWEKSSIRFTVEDNNVEKDLYTGALPLGGGLAAFQKPFFMVLNLAVGGNFTDAANVAQVTSPMPGKMIVDYVRVRKYKGQGEVTIGGSVLANAGPKKAVTDLDRDGKEGVTLDASGSYGAISTYSWSEYGVELASGVKPTINLSTGTHVLTLTVSDGAGNVSTDNVNVEVREIIWEDNFNTFDANLWNVITGDGCSSPTGCGWGNWELETYATNNVTIADIAGEAGNKGLVLEAKKETVGNTQFTSGKITSQNNMAIKYGLVEIRMKSPQIGTGLWPAAWLLGNSISNPAVGWPKCGELDMMEMGHKASARADQDLPNASIENYVGANAIWYEAPTVANPTGAASIAFDKWYNQPYVSASPLKDRFVIYRMYWDNASIRFTVEDQKVERDLYTGPFPLGANTSAFQKPFHLLLNLAVGGNFTDAANAAQVTSPMPGKMIVDYVRVMKYNGQGAVSFKSGLSCNAGLDALMLDADGNGTETVILDGSASTDMDGSIVSYSWKENGVEIATGAIPTLQLAKGTHNITLTITDNQSNTASDDVIAIVSDKVLTALDKVKYQVITNNIDIFPSPVVDILNVTSKIGDVEKIIVFNSFGLKVLEATSTTQVDMSELPAGLYIIEAIIDGNPATRKVLKK